MFKSIIVNFLGIFNSRILGFIRDLLSASVLGANIYSDIFFVAFKFPNLFRRIFAEGAFAQSFLPSFAKAKYKPRFTWLVFKKLFIIILIFSLFVTLFSNLVTNILASGFSEEAKKLASPLIALNFWYLDLIFIVTFLASLLQYKKHFATTAFSTALLNISLIIALLLSMNLPKEQIIWYLSFGVIIGGIAQVIVHLIAARKYKVLKLLYIGAKSKKEADISTFKKHFLPSILGNSTAQISAFIDTWLATFLISGSISYLYYANRLFQLPFALFAIATSTVLFPKITKNLNDGREKEAFESMKKVFWVLFYLLITATVVAIISSKEIIRLLFEHGAFTAKDTEFTSVVLIMYMIGLIPYGLNKLFSSYLYATHKHLKAAKISAISLLVNIVFSVALIFPLKVYGLALASSIGGMVLFILTLKEFGFSEFVKFFEKKYIFYMILVILISIILAIVFKQLILFII
ncbi:murein biosynthesis integral membrane protein MurJ [Nautilia profundicola]|uniref:murein biosynthesis integral membrane protein MurJ n=1 Tax=Nautilia profundicola TaxID=244787 RepID=UPI00059BF9D4|nr:murein biosynthesis integral membrane protein MurJ [Nautilia profundicola]